MDMAMEVANTLEATIYTLEELTKEKFIIEFTT
jgi:hypothetical protein